MKSRQFQVSKKALEKPADGEVDLPPEFERNILKVSPLVAKIITDWRHDPEALVALFTSCHENWKKYTDFKKRKEHAVEVNAMYRQAMEGNNRTDIPFAEHEREKWHAWKRLWGMTTGEAQRRYITLLAKVDPWLVLPKDPEEPPPGFVRTKDDKVVCARANAGKLCAAPLLERHDPKRPTVNIREKLDEDRELLEKDNFRAYLTRVLAPGGHKCRHGEHVAVAPEEAQPFMEWFNLPLVGGYSPYKNQPVIEMIRQYLQRQYNIFEYMRTQDASYFVQVKQLKLVEKISIFYTEVSGEKYVHETECLRDNDHCNRRRQTEGGFNHTHVVLLEWPEVDYTAYSRVVELRLECGRRGLDMRTGVCTDPDRRAQIYIDRLAEFYRVEAVRALAREAQRFRRLRRPHNVRRLRRRRADQAEAALARFLAAGKTAEVLRNVQCGTDPDLEVRGGLTPLVLGAVANAPNFVLTMLQYGASLDYENTHGYTALSWACKADNPEMVKLLLQQGADPFLESEQGFTALMVTVRHNRTRLIDVLLNHVRERATLQYREDRVEGGAVDTEKARLAEEWEKAQQTRRARLAELDALDEADSDSDSSQRPVRESERQQLKVAMKKKQPKHPDEAQSVDDADDGVDPAILAGEEAERRLLNYQNEQGLTPLMLACRHRCVEAAVHLLKRGADASLSIPGADAYDALAIAQAAGYKEIIDLLNEAAAQQQRQRARGSLGGGGKEKAAAFGGWERGLDRRVAKGQLFAALKQGRLTEEDAPSAPQGGGGGGEGGEGGGGGGGGGGEEEEEEGGPCALALVRAGLAMPDQETGGGLTALVVAARRGDHRAVRALLAEGADPNYANRHGYTALMAAADGGHIPTTGELLKAGGDPEVEDLKGRSALTHAAGHAVVGRALVAAAKRGNAAGVAVVVEALEKQAQLRDEGGQGRRGAELLAWLGLHPPDPEFHDEFDSWQWRLPPEAGGTGYAPRRPPPPPPPPPQKDPAAPRCPKCTLEPPCRHYESLAELLEKEPEKARKWRWGHRSIEDEKKWKPTGPLEPPSVEAYHDLNWRMLRKAKIWRETDLSRLSRRLRKRRTNELYALYDAALLAKRPAAQPRHTPRREEEEAVPALPAPPGAGPPPPWSRPHSADPAALLGPWPAAAGGAAAATGAAAAAAAIEAEGGDAAAALALGLRPWPGGVRGEAGAGALAGGEGGGGGAAAAGEPTAYGYARPKLRGGLPLRPLSAASGQLLQERLRRRGLPVPEFDPRAEELGLGRADPGKLRPVGDVLEAARPEIPLDRRRSVKPLSELPEYVLKEQARKRAQDRRVSAEAESVLPGGEREQDRLRWRERNQSQENSMRAYLGLPDKEEPAAGGADPPLPQIKEGEDEPSMKDSISKDEAIKSEKSLEHAMDDLYQQNFHSNMQKPSSSEATTLSSGMSLQQETHPHRTPFSPVQSKRIDLQEALPTSKPPLQQSNAAKPPSEAAAAAAAEEAARIASELAAASPKSSRKEDAPDFPPGSGVSGTPVRGAIEHREAAGSEGEGPGEAGGSAPRRVRFTAAPAAAGAGGSGPGGSSSSDGPPRPQGELPPQGAPAPPGEAPPADGPAGEGEGEGAPATAPGGAGGGWEGGYDYFGGGYEEPVDEAGAEGAAGAEEALWEQYYGGGRQFQGDADSSAVLAKWYAPYEGLLGNGQVSTSKLGGSFVCGKCKKKFGRSLGQLKTARLCDSCLADRKKNPPEKVGNLHRKLQGKLKGGARGEDDAVGRFNALCDELDGASGGVRKKSLIHQTDKAMDSLSNLHELLLAGRAKASGNARDVAPDGFEQWKMRLADYEERRVFEDHLTNEQLAAREAARKGLTLYTRPPELDLAEWMLAQGRTKKVRPLIESALKEQRAALGADAPEVALTLRVRAKLLSAKGKLNEARATLEESYEILVAKLGPTHKECVNSSELVGNIYMDQGQFAQARTLYGMLAKEHQGSDDPGVAALRRHYLARARAVDERRETELMEREDAAAMAIEDRLRRPDVYAAERQGKAPAFCVRLLRRQGPGAKASFKKFKKFARDYGAEFQFGFYVDVHEFSQMKPKQEGFAKKARFIYKEYVKPQFKLPFLTKLIRADLTQCMEEAVRPLTPDLYDQAQALCLEAVFKGPYLQFMDTDDGAYFAERQQGL